VDTARISPPAGGERRQQLQEAVDAAPRPQDSPGDDYISVLKDEVSTTVVVDEAVVLPAQTGASPAARAGQRAYVYTVRNGDSLWIIAKRVYGDGLRWARIFDANRDTVANADILEVGQRLKIPKE
jgi:nucleoid-associated protein YgaU